MAPTGQISVIVRARDEERELQRCLSLIAGQREVGEVEVVLVDGGSRDGTIEVARAHGVPVLSARSDPYSYGGALNLGASRCAGEVLVALSAHAFPPDHGWLARLRRAFTDPEVACVAGDRYGPDGEALSSAVAQDEALARRRPEWGYSNAAGAFRGDLWRRRPFRADLPACEDKEWALYWLEQGYRCLVDPSVNVEHDHTHDSLRRIFERSRREAVGYAMFLPRPRPRPGDLAREWWGDVRWYDSAARARLSHRRAARLLGAYAGRRLNQG
jgi:rhamnosyltransferase